MKTYPFDGQRLTFLEIQQRVPRLGERTIYRHLAEGRMSTAAMLGYNPAQGRSKGGKIAAKKSRSRGWGFA